MTDNLYHYRAFVAEVYDGDTCTIEIDLGFHVHVERIKLRLFDLDTPELRGLEKEQGLKARDYLRDLILNRLVIVRTFKDATEKYGRYLAEIWTDQNGDWILVNQLMREFVSKL